MIDKTTNYIKFPPLVTDYIVKTAPINALSENLENERHVVQTLYLLDRIQEAKTGDLKTLYPILSKYNSTTDPEIQTFLAGIYRKIQVPDAFGPLIAMLIKNIINPPNTYFDPNEEIGGAILSYLA